MTEPQLLLLLVGLACVATAVLLRASLAASLVNLEARRLVSAVRNAGAAFGWKQLRQSAAVSAGLLALSGLFSFATGLFTWDSISWLGLGIVVASLSTLLVGRLAFYQGLRAAACTAEAAGRQAPAGLAIALRSGGLVSLVAELCALLVVSATILPLIDSTPAEAQLLLSRSRWILTGLGLGASGIAMVSQLTGSALLAAGERGRSDPRLNPGGLHFQIDPKNPTMVLNLVAPSAGTSVSRAEDFAALSLLSHAVMLNLLLPDAGLPTDPALAPLLLLPLLLRAIAVSATGLILSVTQLDDTTDPNAIFWYGQVGVACVTATAVIGATRWMFGPQHWAPMMLPALLGVAAQLLFSTLARRRSSRATPALRRLRGMTASPSASFVGEGFAASALQTAIDLVLLSLVVGAAWYLGQNSGWKSGISAALSMTLAGFMSGAAFSGALTLYGPTVEGACRVASVLPGKKAGGIRSEVKSWLVNMDFSAVSGMTLGHIPLVAATAITGVLGVVLLSGLHGAVLSAAAYPWLAPGALLGTGMVLVFAGLAIRTAGNASATAAAELDRQLSNLAPQEREGSAPVFPGDFSPRYKDHLALASSVAFGPKSWGALAALALPLAVGLLLFWGNSERPAIPLPLAVFLFFATATGTTLAWFAGSSWATFTGVRRLTRVTQDSSPAYWGDGIAQTLGTAAGPAAHIAVKQVIASCVLFAVLLVVPPPPQVTPPPTPESPAPATSAAQVSNSQPE